MHAQTRKNPDSRRWRRRKEARPGEIIDAALDLFVERGYDRTHLTEVAERAGVTKGTVYLYFESKEALFQAMVRELLVPLVERAEQQAGSFTGTTADLLRDMSRFWQETVMNTRLSGIPKLIIAESGNFPELAQFYYDHIVHRGTRLVTRILERGIRRGEFRDCDVRHVAHVIMAPMIFCAIWKHSLGQIDPAAFEIEPFFAAHLEIVLHGLQVPGTEANKEQT